VPAARSRFGIALAVLAAMVVALGLTLTSGTSLGAQVALPAAPTTPIQHVVVLYMENHSFDNVLGRLCVNDHRCDGAVRGKVSNGTTIDLKSAQDVVPDVGHNHSAQVLAIDGGRMDKFDKINGCSQLHSQYACYQAYTAVQIPNLAALARQYVISDRTFESELTPTFGSHVFLLAGQLGGFSGDNPESNQKKGGIVPGGGGGKNPGPGWGCDSGLDAQWRSSPTASYIKVPSCFPDQTGFGPYRSSPVPWIPTIMDRLQGAGLSWRIYRTEPGHPGYTWAGCPYFAECLYGPQGTNSVLTDQLLPDAQAGLLPAVSFVFPIWDDSQHNKASMAQGDNFIGDVVNAIMSGPQWSSTAIFITYDDCGCFYDHVPPPNGLGIRVPMVIVSPYAKPAYTDSTVASFASILAFIDHNWQISPLSTADGSAYDYAGSFDFTQQPVARVATTHTTVPDWERRWIAAHPPDPNDPN
jgi:phospholipase C